MRNVTACLKHRLTIHSTVLRNGNYGETMRWRLMLLGGSKNVVRRMNDNDTLLRFSHPKFFSSGYSSVHGERPSAEYAKLRKESLESQFGRALGSKSVSVLYRFGPFLALYRGAIISFHVLKLTIWSLFVHDMKKRAVKLGQALSTRPDILPKVYCQELAELQDQIPPFPTRVAIKSIESQLGMPISEIFADISEEPIAAASLGQVYKAHLHSGELVAVKVQRPGMSHLLTTDALLFKMIGGQLKRFAKARKDLLVAVNEMVRHMFEEIDYVLEGQNAERFADLYGCHSCNEKTNSKDNSSTHQKIGGVKVPKIYWKLTRKAVLTMEWLDGIKLTNESRLREASLNRKQLIDEGVYCSLRQLLEVGFFHADPHPGNLVATEDGSLAYFDFGMMGDIPRHYRVGLIRVLVHFVNRDSLGLANDFLSLGFIPEGVDLQSVSDALQASFGDATKLSQDFQGIMNQLYDVMYEFNFTLPPDYALVIRALGSLEGTAKVLDPDFKVVESAYPFVIGRLLMDPTPDMRKILGQLVIRNDGSIRWNRLEKLIVAISQQTSESDETSSNPQETTSNPMGWKSFNMRAVVAATEDLLQFILSNKGSRVRVFLIRDILKAADTFLEHELVPSSFNKKYEATRKPESEDEAMVERVVNGFGSLRSAVKLAPDVWTAMVIRLALKPEFQRFGFDVVSALLNHSRHKLPDTMWVCMSRVIHMLSNNSSRYSSHHKGYRCLDPKTHKIYISRHVRFLDTTFLYAADQPPISKPSSVPNSLLPLPVTLNPLPLPPHNSPLPTPTSIPPPPLALDSPPLPTQSSPPPPHPMITRTKDNTHAPRKLSDYVTYTTTTQFSADPTSFTQAINFLTGAKPCLTSSLHFTETKRGHLSLLLPMLILWVANGFFVLNLNLMVLSIATRLALLPRAIINPKASTTLIHSVLFAKKQPTVARSSTEAEYRSIALTAAELCWIKSLLGEIGLSHITPTLWCDNLGATFLSADPVSHARTKHIEIVIDFVRDLVSKKSLYVRHISASGQIADVMTKALAITAFRQLHDKLTVASSMSLRGADNVQE
ncbi:hypothetical protein BUALT_Bualt05G0026200 [Buddleja alternifolia]|uniref:ABC1 atypical kinase-like domain-containing protein n=1 Tax=Buddleja alternifolia TaxID=168488 RepID=A0AAV6XS72_9LAMI|nr:hypothetical protein BUALT_Bualt05G0026200 [Buddleja alternifolia]